MHARTVLFAYLGVALLLVAPTHADMASAGNALARGNAADAFKEYERLAQLGNATAQFDVGTMLLKGQGVAQDVVSGAAWLIAAKENEQAKSSPETDAVLAALSAEQTSAARELADQRMRDAAALLPKRTADLPKTDADHHSKLAPLTGGSDNVFDRELRKLHAPLAWATVRVVIDSDGQLVDVWTTEADPTFEVAVAAIAAVRTMRFIPAAAEGAGVVSSFPFRLTRTEAGISPSDPKFRAFFANARAAADSGDKASRYALARMSTVFKALSPAILDADRTQTWMSELASEPDQARAMYVFPDVLFSGDSHTGSDVRRAEYRRWRVRSAQAGFAPAQLDMALMCWSEHAPDSLEHARRWLESASGSGFFAASRYLAALLLLPQYRQSGGLHALELTTPLLQNPVYKDDPDTWQLVAAAHAAQGKFTEAIEHEWRAITLLPKGSLREQKFAAHLESFKSKAAIDDELLAIPAAGYY